MRRIILLFIVFVAIHANAQEKAQELFRSSSETSSAFWKRFKEDSVLSFRSAKGYFPTLIHNFGYQATFPFRMKGRDFAIVGATAASTLVLIYYDQELDDNVFRPIKADNEGVSNVSHNITDLGDYYGYILLAGYAGYSVVFHKYRAFRTSLLASQAAITAGVWIRIGKLFSGRMRPGVTYTDSVYTSDHWFGPFAQLKSEYKNYGVAYFDAFPSGHTGAAFAMATVFAEAYKDQKAIPIVMYSVASIIGITRLIEHEHWASDVLLGGIIGYYCGKQVMKNERKLFPHYSIASRKTQSYFFPYSHAGAYGVGWKMIF